MQLRILDPKLQTHVELLKVVLLYSADLTLLPELYDVFGEENLLKFLDVFAGTTIKVPSSEFLEEAIRDVSVYLGLKGKKGHKRARTVRSMESDYLLTEDAIRDIERKVASVIENQMGFDVLLGRYQDGKKG